MSLVNINLTIIIATSKETNYRKFNFRELELVLDSSKVELTPVEGQEANAVISDADRTTIQRWIVSHTKASFERVINQTLKGDMQQMVKIPLSSILPTLALNFGALFAEKMLFPGSFVEFGLSPASLNLISKRVNDKLKEVETSFDNDDKKDAF